MSARWGAIWGMPDAKVDTRKVIVTSVEEIAGRDGWTLYAVQATTPDGVAIVAELRSFQVLPVGEVIDVEVERRDHETYGTSFTLKRPRPSTRQLQDSLEQQKMVLGALTGRVEALEEKISRPLPR